MPIYLSNSLLPAVAALLGIVLMPGAAEAHAHLVTSSPAANSSGSAPDDIELRFSEAPLARFSGAQLVAASGAAVPASTRAADGNTLSIVPNAALPPGTYTVKWHVVTADTHRAQGALAFTVH
jgi:methionine-rich copper-binding protein CopC